jgi:spore maturation protein CgeB
VKLNVVFFNSRTFLKKELLAALKRRPDIHTLSVEIPVLPPADSAEAVFEQLRPFLPGIVVSLNDAGFDQAGVLSRRIAETGSYVLNWYYDDPLYERIYNNRVIADLSRRIDFVSEASFVPFLAARGHTAHFLPLATDPAFFNTDIPIDDALRTPAYAISFVGNSSLEFMDSIITEQAQKEMDKFKPLLVRLKNIYFRNPREDLRDYLQSHSDEWEKNLAMDRERFMFAMVWMIGYLYRRDFVVGLANAYKERFMCFGDAYWTKFIDPWQVSADAMYYKNLCSYYRSSKINININRIQTLTSFTQRIFDCKASGAFLLTDRRAMNGSYFFTEGPGREIVEYDSLAHCRELIDYYLSHDEERERIALAGRNKVLSLHTYDNRVEEMLSTAQKKWGF